MCMGNTFRKREILDRWVFGVDVTRVVPLCYQSVVGKAKASSQSAHLVWEFILNRLGRGRGGLAHKMLI